MISHILIRFNLLKYNEVPFILGKHQEDEKSDVIYQRQ